MTVFTSLRVNDEMGACDSVSVTTSVSHLLSTCTNYCHICNLLSASTDYVVLLKYSLPRCFFVTASVRPLDCVATDILLGIQCKSFMVCLLV